MTLAAAAASSEGLVFRVSGLGFKVRGLGFRVWGSGFRLEGPKSTTIFGNEALHDVSITAITVLRIHSQWMYE